MKRIILAGFLLVFSLFYLQAQEVVVKDCSGKVEFQIPGGSWEKVEKGISIPLKATIATGFQSRAVLESPRSTIVVQPLTRLTIEELQSRSSGSRTSLSLRTGRISATVKKSEEEPTRFQVRSPIATASVRGTEFSFNGYQLSVQSGLVAFGQAGSRQVTVPLGKSTEITKDGTPTSVREAILNEVQINPMAAPPSVLPFIQVPGFLDLSIDDLVVTVQ